MSFSGVTDARQILDSSYYVSVVDSNSLSFLFKHAPEAAEKLHVGPEFQETSGHHHRQAWQVRNLHLIPFPDHNKCDSDPRVHVLPTFVDHLVPLVLFYISCRNLKWQIFLR